ncbi:MAG: polyprenyl synthetase family protein [Bacillota bacterium]|nr:polyprenyl synthetase family protein [Bacillota bacterium]
MEELLSMGKRSPYFKEIRAAIKSLDKEIYKFLASDHKLLNTAAIHLHKSGGKRLRPAFIYLGGFFGTYDREKLTPMAMAMEITHMATLVHDDIVDNAPLRRGKPTVRKRWGNQVSVYTGTYLLAKAMSLTAGYNSPKIDAILAETALDMCRGEIDQMRAKGRVEKDIDNYLKRIKRKTALLFAASCEMGAYISGAPEYVVEDLKNFGENLGMAFQITDDILDFSPEAEKFGKVLGGDIREGIMTLPLIYTASLRESHRELDEIFAKEQRSDRDVETVVKIVRDAGGIDYAKTVAANYSAAAQEVLKKLPSGDLQDTLGYITQKILKRQI